MKGISHLRQPQFSYINTYTLHFLKSKILAALAILSDLLSLISLNTFDSLILIFGAEIIF
jgi:hypothetical protein